MPWYSGPSLLELLESLPSALDTRTAPFRFPVQRVLRPDHTFRGFAGQIASGTIRPGDAITVLAFGPKRKVERIVTFDGDLEEAIAPLSVTLVLDREVDISRGDLIVSAESTGDGRREREGRAGVDGSAAARTESPLSAEAHQPDCPAFVTSIDHRTNMGTLAHEAAETLEMNDIGVVTLQPAAADRVGSVWRESRHRRIHSDRPGDQQHRRGGHDHSGRRQPDAAKTISCGRLGTGDCRRAEARWGHRGGVLELNGTEGAD